MAETLHQIKHRITGKVLFELECGSLKMCVTAAVESGAYLSGAYLSRAYLSRADLSGADLIDGGQERRGHRFIGWLKDGEIQIIAGCRHFNIEQARAHWGDSDYHGGAEQGAECLARVELVASIAELRGWLTESAAQASE